MLLPIALLVTEFVYNSAPFPSCHASTIVETAPGEFLAAWFGGKDEGAKDVAIWSARRGTDGKWTAPVEIAREPNQPTWNPVLFHSKDGVLWLYYKVGPSPQTWSGARRFSKDGGRSWSPIELLPSGLLGPIKDKPLVLRNGTIVSGTSSESYRTWASWVERSTDNGNTWTKHGPITGVDSIQPSVVPLGNKLMLFVRTQTAKKIYYSESTDEGRTWSELKPTNLPNPNSGTDAVALKDGRLVMIYNHTERGRSPLNLAVSKDGVQWTQFKTLESEPGEFSYPAIIQAADGSLQMTYTWNRRKIRYTSVPLTEVPR